MKYTSQMEIQILPSLSIIKESRNLSSNLSMWTKKNHTIDCSSIEKRNTRRRKKNSNKKNKDRNCFNQINFLFKYQPGN